MQIPIRNLFLFLSFLVFVLLTMHFFSKGLQTQYPRGATSVLHDRFNINEEANIPAWYSTVLLFSVSVTSIIIYHLRNICRNQQPWRLFWLGFGAAYGFFSLDEAARLHEIIDRTTSVKWVYAYAPFVGMFFIVCTYYCVVIRKDDKKLRIWILGGLIIYAIGGLVLEFVKHYFGPLSPVLKQIEYVTEEGLEMIGAIMVLMGCFHELNNLLEKNIQLYKGKDSQEKEQKS